MRKRLIVSGAAVVVGVGLTIALWTLFDGPPPGLIFRHGLPPAGGPTGRTRTIDGVELAEIAPGYRHVRRHLWNVKGDLLGRICRPLGLPFGTRPEPSAGFVDRWVESPATFWIGTATLRPDDWPGSPTWEEVCSTLGERREGSFRRPDRDEVLFASCAGALGEEIVERFARGPWESAPIQFFGTRWENCDASEFALWVRWWNANKDWILEQVRSDDGRLPRRARSHLLVWTPPAGSDREE